MNSTTFHAIEEELDVVELVFGILIVGFVSGYNIPVLVEVLRTRTVHGINYSGLVLQLGLNLSSLGYAIYRSLVPYYVSNTCNLCVVIALLACKRLFTPPRSPHLPIQTKIYTDYEKAWLSSYRIASV